MARFIVALCLVATPGPFVHAEPREPATLKGHAGRVVALAFSPDGRTLASGSWDKTVKLWDVTAGKQTASFLQSSKLSVVVFSPDGGTLASGGWDAGLTLRDVATGKARTVPTGHRDWISSACFSPDGKSIAVGSYDATITVWDAATGQARVVLKGHAKSVGTVLFSPDGKALASGSNDNSIKLWDLGRAVASSTLTGHAAGVTGLAFNAGGGSLSSASDDRMLKVWNLSTGEGRDIPWRLSEPVRVLGVSSDGRMLASAGKGDEVCLWEVATGQLRRRLPDAGSGPVTALAFSPDGRVLASGGQDLTIRLQGVAKAEETVAANLTEKALAAIWTDLAGPDAAVAFAGMCRLTGSPAQALPFLKAKLSPVPQADPKAMARLIADLDSDEFDVREKASQGLARFGEAAELALKECLKGQPSAEARRRVEELLARLKQGEPTGEVLRAIRAVEVLEHTGGPEARAVLEAVAKGAPEAYLTRDAKASLVRLEQRVRANP